MCVPIDLSTIWDKRQVVEGVPKPWLYTRSDNPNRAALAEQVASINGFKSKGAVCCNINGGYMVVALLAKADEEVIVISNSASY